MSVGIDDTGFHASSLCITLIGQTGPGLIDRHKIGNSCPASLDIGLLFMLENDPEDLSGCRAGLLSSHGSGGIGSFSRDNCQGIRPVTAGERTLAGGNPGERSIMTNTPCCLNTNIPAWMAT